MFQKNKVHIYNVVRIVLVTYELGAPTKWFNTVLVFSISAIVSVGGRTA
jgi:hypothetical protein